LNEPPEAAAARFAKLARQLADGDERQEPHRKGFGTASLFVGRKMFGRLSDSGALVLKLPPNRVEALIASGVGSGWHPGSGTPLKEYVAIGTEHQGSWLRLAKESRQYMASKR
jgi:hypothetical protein